MRDQIGPRFTQNTDEILFGQRAQFNPDRQAPLQFGQHIAGFRHMERAAGDEQDMVGLHRAIFGRDRGPFNQRQKIALHAFAADTATSHIADRNLVNLVEEDDAVGFGILQRDAGDIVLIHALFSFFIDQLVPRIGNLELAALGVGFAECLAHHVAEIDHTDLAAHAAQIHRHSWRISHFDLDLCIVHRIVDDPLAETLARCLARILADQRIEQTVHCGVGGSFPHRFTTALFLQPDRFFGKVARNLFNVAPDIADLGKLGRFYLYEGCLCQLGQTTRYLGLAAAGGANHQDVLGRHLVAQFRAQLLPAPAVAQSHGDSALGILLANNMLVQSGDNRLRGQCFGHAIS